MHALLVGLRNMCTYLNLCKYMCTYVCVYMCVKKDLYVGMVIQMALLS